MDLRERLLPCPFCGGEAESSVDFETAGYRLVCYGEECPANPEVIGSDRAEAVELWNQRAALAAPREPDGWIVEWEWAPGTGHNRELWGRKEYAEDDAAERRMKYPDIEFVVRPVYIGAPAPAETEARG